MCLIQSVVKLNSDGCSRGNLGRSRGGCLFTDCDGRFLLAILCYFGETTSLLAELKALLYSVQLGVSRRLVNLHWNLTHWFLSILFRGILVVLGVCRGSYKTSLSIDIILNLFLIIFVRRINRRIDCLMLGLRF